VTASDISSAMADEARRRYEAAVASSPQQRPKVRITTPVVSAHSADVPPCCELSEPMHQAQCSGLVGNCPELFQT
jgi:hypothetical protein